MRYVKSKIVKKMKQDSIPSSVADKYLNIYKELIERERKKASAGPVANFSHVHYQKDLSSRSDLSFNPRLKQNMQKGKADE